ncbi:hypothetical protein FKM82_030499 [Ascaphus truei]
MTLSGAYLLATGGPEFPAMVWGITGTGFWGGCLRSHSGGSAPPSLVSPRNAGWNPYREFPHRDERFQSHTSLSFFKSSSLYSQQ